MRIQRVRLAIAIAPIVASGLVGGLTLVVAEYLFGNGFVGFDAFGFYVAACGASMLGALFFSFPMSLGRPLCVSFWSSAFALLGGLPVLMLYGSIDLSSDAQAGVGLVFGPIVASILALIGGTLGRLFGGRPPLRFETASERLLAGTHCAACGYTLDGLRAPKCPECGAAIPDKESR